jgi:acetoin utilization deacetylase AcuC-like enzyme
MKVVYNELHSLHAAQHEFFRGEKVEAFEKPSRADFVLNALRDAKLGEIVPMRSFPDAELARVHDERYLRFIRDAHDEYAKLGGTGDAFPSVWPIRGMRSDVEPRNFAARMGLYSFDSGTPFTRGAYAAARAGADCALTGAKLLSEGERSAFVLTRPPGHHAGSDFFGGYCFLNNAAIAAQYLRDHGAHRVAILDVDYHHGNGTQEIFYSRNDVLFASIHADPSTDYPFFLGYEEEMGIGAGAGFNMNMPLAQGSEPEVWFEALAIALRRIEKFAADALVVSLGVDTFEGDPISHFKLRTREDYPRLGELIAKLKLPTLFVLEGGYAVKEIGDNVVAVLAGFDGAL